MAVQTGVDVVTRVVDETAGGVRSVIRNIDYIRRQASLDARGVAGDILGQEQTFEEVLDAFKNTTVEMEGEARKAGRRISDIFGESGTNGGRLLGANLIKGVSILAVADSVGKSIEAGIDKVLNREKGQSAAAAFGEGFLEKFTDFLNRIPVAGFFGRQIQRGLGLAFFGDARTDDERLEQGRKEAEKNYEEFLRRRQFDEEKKRQEQAVEERIRQEADEKERQRLKSEEEERRSREKMLEDAERLRRRLTDDTLSDEERRRRDFEEELQRIREDGLGRAIEDGLRREFEEREKRFAEEERRKQDAEQERERQRQEQEQARENERVAAEAQRRRDAFQSAEEQLASGTGNLGSTGVRERFLASRDTVATQALQEHRKANSFLEQMVEQQKRLADSLEFAGANLGG